MSRPTVVITGGSSGIGAAVARRFANEGYNIVITYKSNESGASDVLKELFQQDVQAIGVQADLTKDADAKKVIDTAVKEFGSIDVLVNNAGGYINGDEWNGEAAVWEESLKQNLVSVMSMSKYTAEVFNQNKSGIIVNIASRYSLAGQYDAISYGAAKAGVANVTQSYAKLLAPWGRANAISPGAVRAGYWLTAPEEEIREAALNNPLNKLVEPAEIAEMAYFLASDKAKSITGQNIVVDAGFGLK